MSIRLTLQAARDLFAKGLFEELVECSRDIKASQAQTEAELVAIAAHAHAVTGDLASARNLTSRLAKEHLTGELEARRLVILGLIAEREGSSEVAVRHYGEAVVCATQSRESGLAAWADLYRFRSLLDGRPKTEAMAMLPSLRRQVARAGDPQAVAYLHMCIAVLEGQSGNFDEAYRHSTLANGFLEVADHRALRASNLVSLGCLDVFSFNLQEGEAHFRLARALALEAGDRSTAAAAESNLAHVNLLRGDLHHALALFRAAVESGTKSRATFVGTLDGLARTYLALGDLSACQRALEDIDRIKVRQKLATTLYHVRWASLTKAKLLLKTGAYDECGSLLRSLRARTDSIDDRPFEATLSLTRAWLSSKTGSDAGAAHDLVSASVAGAISTPETRPQFYYVAGTIAASCDRSLGLGLRARACRIWSTQGVVSPRLEHSEEQLNLDVARTELGASIIAPPPTVDSLQTLATSLVASLDMGASPRLLGMELLSIIRALECSPGAHLATIAAEGPKLAQQRLTVPLGPSDGVQLVLVCPLPAEPDKAVILADLLRLVEAARVIEAARTEEKRRAALWPATSWDDHGHALYIGEEMRAILRTAQRVATALVPVLITGETGTGKEVLARTIHKHSDRSRGPFVPFNCSATPRDMVDAQLFGHRRGAFTGATEHSPGVLRAASHGTLFLDEIGETPYDTQPKLLRFLESGEVHPIGEPRPVQVNTRVIAATNADLDSMVSLGRFREDLFYRLNVIRLHLPPLRERREEIGPLAEHYLNQYAIEAKKPGLRLAEETVDCLLLYRWPGNIRQLANEMRRVATLADSPVIMPDHLTSTIVGERQRQPLAIAGRQSPDITIKLDQTLDAAVAQVERAAIQHALDKCGGHLEDTAATLGLSRKGLYLKRHRLGLGSPGAAV